MEKKIAAIIAGAVMTMALLLAAVGAMAGEKAQAPDEMRPCVCQGVAGGTHFAMPATACPGYCQALDAEKKRESAGNNTVDPIPADPVQALIYYNLRHMGENKAVEPGAAVKEFRQHIEEQIKNGKGAIAGQDPKADLEREHNHGPSVQKPKEEKTEPPINCTWTEYSPFPIFYFFGPRPSISVPLKFKDLEEAQTGFRKAIGDGSIDEFIEAHSEKGAWDKARDEYKNTLVGHYSGINNAAKYTDFDVKFSCHVVDDEAEGDMWIRMSEGTEGIIWKNK